MSIRGLHWGRTRLSRCRHAPNHHSVCRRPSVGGPSVERASEPQWRVRGRGRGIRGPGRPRFPSRSHERPVYDLPQPGIRALFPASSYIRRPRGVCGVGRACLPVERLRLPDVSGHDIESADHQRRRVCHRVRGTVGRTAAARRDPRRDRRAERSESAEWIDLWQSLCIERRRKLTTCVRLGPPPAAAQLALIRTDGSGSRQVTNEPLGFTDAVLSGNGAVVYAATVDGRLLKIDVVNGQAEQIIAGQSAISQVSRTLSPGSVGSISGSGLSGTTVSSPTLPLPDHLADVQVLLNGSAVPILSVNPNQIVFQVPWEAPVEVGRSKSNARKLLFRV